jgi:hypothetical protein
MPAILASGVNASNTKLNPYFYQNQYPRFEAFQYFGVVCNVFGTLGRCGARLPKGPIAL